MQGVPDGGTGPQAMRAGEVDFGYRTVRRAEKSHLVREVFDSVAPRYDLMNDLMSLGIHRAWKRQFVAALDPRPGRTLLDLAGGTGDVTYGWRARGGGEAILSDINASMLGVGRSRGLDAASRQLLPGDLSTKQVSRDSAMAQGIGGVTYLVADAERLPLPDRCVDRVSIAFGLRNCTDKPAVLAEARRVLRPGGRFLCLEFSRVQVAALRPLYDAWSFQVLPRLGRLVAGDAESYQYLAESIRTFPDQETLARMMREAGLRRVEARNLTGGIVAIHSGWRL